MRCRLNPEMIGGRARRLLRPSITRLDSLDAGRGQNACGHVGFPSARSQTGMSFSENILLDDGATAVVGIEATDGRLLGKARSR
jgi:hypothetical protein